MTTNTIKARLKNARVTQDTISELMKNGQIPAFEGAAMWARVQKEMRWLISLL
jgi:hypothetical protein